MPAVKMPRLSVIGLKEEGQWCAIALELSVRGYGSTFDEAKDDLKAAIRAQVTFAMEQHGNIDGIFCRAEQRYFDLYAEGLKQLAKEGLGVKNYGTSFAETDDQNPWYPSDMPRAITVLMPRPRRSKAAFALAR